MSRTYFLMKTENMFDFLLQNICSCAIIQKRKQMFGKGVLQKDKRSIGMKEKQKRSVRAYTVYGNTATVTELAPEEDTGRQFTVISGTEKQTDPDGMGMTTELTGAGIAVSVLLGLLETCLIFLTLKLSLSFIPVFAVAMLWVSLAILTGAFLELLLFIFGKNVYTDIRLQPEIHGRQKRMRICLR